MLYIVRHINFIRPTWKWYQSNALHLHIIFLNLSRIILSYSHPFIATKSKFVSTLSGEINPSQITPLLWNMGLKHSVHKNEQKTARQRILWAGQYKVYFHIYVRNLQSYNEVGKWRKWSWKTDDPIKQGDEGWGGVRIKGHGGSTRCSSRYMGGSEGSHFLRMRKSVDLQDIKLNVTQGSPTSWKLPMPRKVYQRPPPTHGKWETG